MSSPRSTAGMVLVSTGILAGLAIAATLWVVVLANFVTLWHTGPRVVVFDWWRSHFAGLPWNPVVDLAPFNCVAVMFALSPWGALVAFAMWKLEGLWLDFLDPYGRALFLTTDESERQASAELAGIG